MSEPTPRTTVPRPPRRRRRRLLGLGCLTLAGSLGLSRGCRPPVTPPSEVADPVTVYLIVAELHSGLALPDGPGRWLEVSFGERAWYAEGRESWWRLPAVVLWPTEGVLGRRRVRASDEEQLRRGTRATRLHALDVERSAVDELRRELEREFADQQTLRGRTDMDFVPAEDYWMPHNCHDATARWLESLGCEVGRLPIRMGLRLDQD